MSDTRKAGPDKPADPAAGPGRFGQAGLAHPPRFTVAAHGDNVVLVDVLTGRSWALALADDSQPVWQPVVFAGQAERAPKASAKDEGE